MYNIQYMIYNVCGVCVCVCVCVYSYTPKAPLTTTLGR